MFIVFVIVSGLSFAENVIDRTKETSFLFVLSGNSGSLDGDKLTLNGVPNVVYFSDRPNRIAGHITLEEFVESWNQGMDSFKIDPPNAVLSVIIDDETQNAVVELLSSKQENSALHFKVKILEGDIKGSFEMGSLFIDIFIGAHPGCLAGLC